MVLGTILLLDMKRFFMHPLRDVVMVPEPEGLAEALRAEGHSSLGQEDLRRLREDGVLFLRGVIRNKTMLRQVEPAAFLHKQVPGISGKTLPPNALLMNGVLRAIAREGPLAPLVAQAFGNRPLVTNDNQVWGRLKLYEEVQAASQELIHRGLYHADATCEDGSDCFDERDTMYAAWLALSDAPRAMSFFRGSHREEAMNMVFEAGCAVYPEGDGGYPSFNGSCLLRINSTLSQLLGRQSFWFAPDDMQAGDVLLFNGRVLHTGHSYGRQRTAFCLRLKDARLGHEDICEDMSEAYEGRVLVYPKNESQLDCLPWVTEPWLQSKSPVVPAESGVSWRSRLGAAIAYFRGARFPEDGQGFQFDDYQPEMVRHAVQAYRASLPRRRWFSPEAHQVNFM